MPMGGAAGGLAAGLVFFAKAELAGGAAWVLERCGFDAALAKADLVITAEGMFDRTSLVGKAPGEVLRRAQAAHKKVAVVAGKVEGLIGVHAVGGDGDGRMLDASALSRMAEQVAREALHM
jgi:glycerate kinase